MTSSTPLSVSFDAPSRETLVRLIPHTDRQQVLEVIAALEVSTIEIIANALRSGIRPLVLQQLARACLDSANAGAPVIPTISYNLNELLANGQSRAKYGIPNDMNDPSEVARKVSEYYEGMSKYFDVIIDGVTETNGVRVGDSAPAKRHKPLYRPPTLAGPQTNVSHGSGDTVAVPTRDPPTRHRDESFDARNPYPGVTKLMPGRGDVSGEVKSHALVGQRPPPVTPRHPARPKSVSESDPRRPVSILETGWSKSGKFLPWITNHRGQYMMRISESTVLKGESLESVAQASSDARVYGLTHPNVTPRIATTRDLLEIGFRGAEAMEESQLPLPVEPEDGETAVERTVRH